MQHQLITGFQSIGQTFELLIGICHRRMNLVATPGNSRDMQIPDPNGGIERTGDLPPEIHVGYGIMGWVGIFEIPSFHRLLQTAPDEGQQVRIERKPLVCPQGCNSHPPAIDGVDELACRVVLARVLGHVGGRDVMAVVEKWHAEPVETMAVGRVRTDILDDEEHLKLGRVKPRIVLLLRHTIGAGEQPQAEREADCIQFIERTKHNRILLDEKMRPALAVAPGPVAILRAASHFQDEVTVGRAASADQDLLAFVLIGQIIGSWPGTRHGGQAVLRGPLAQPPGRDVVGIPQMENSLHRPPPGGIGIAQQKTPLELQIGEQVLFLSCLPGPGTETDQEDRQNQQTTSSRRSSCGHRLQPSRYGVRTY